MKEFIVIQFNECSYDTHYRTRQLAEFDPPWSLNIHNAWSYESKEDAQIVVEAMKKDPDCTYHVLEIHPLW